ncbi:hypothetical protein IGI04_014748 [Brassica rapa subsp. trilocularis]|uniref:Uncharacterized protein n=1 Tax=Brassica rapa subsp. trilocularis TaxID=1813537 RepID=A0ABQ7MN26_BRACM|nr:hypothetical protein IGI04_014748 [Brassica rapa subsp. trilocularis]
MGIKSTWPERKRERNKVVDLECSRFSPRRLVPSNRRFSTIVTRKLCLYQSVQATHSTSSDQSKFCSILHREVRRTVQELKEVMSESRSVVQTCQFLHDETEDLSKSRSVQSSQVVHWVLAKSSPINQLLIGKEHCSRYLEVGSWQEAGTARLVFWVLRGKEGYVSMSLRGLAERLHKACSVRGGCWKACSVMWYHWWVLHVALGKDDRIA